MLRSFALATALLCAAPASASFVTYSFNTGPLQYIDVAEPDFEITDSFTIDQSLLPAALPGSSLFIIAEYGFGSDPDAGWLYAMESRSGALYGDVGTFGTGFLVDCECWANISTDYLVRFDDAGDIVEWEIYGFGDPEDWLSDSLGTIGSFYYDLEYNFESDIPGTWTRSGEVLTAAVPIGPMGPVLAALMAALALVGRRRQARAAV